MDLQVSVNHNQAVLLEPSDKYPELDLMFIGLNNCRITHALTAKPTMDRLMIIDFWSHAVFVEGDAPGQERIESVVQGHQILIDEARIRQALQIDDSPTDPVTLSPETINQILRMMDYEGTQSRFFKRLFPPFWRFLCHVYIHSMTAKRTGLHHVNYKYMAGICALANNLPFNFSRFIFNEMKENLAPSNPKTKKFLMYPRFIQMIVDTFYHQIPKSNYIFDLKFIGSSAITASYGNTKTDQGQNFVGGKPLRLFGKFGGDLVIEEPEGGNNVEVAGADLHQDSDEDEVLREAEHVNLGSPSPVREVGPSTDVVSSHVEEEPQPAEPQSSHAAAGPSHAAEGPSEELPPLEDQPISRTPGPVFSRSCDLVMDLE